MLSNNHGKEFVGQDVKKVLEGKVDVLAILLGMNDLLKPEVEDSDESLDAWAARYRELATNLRSRTRPRELLLGTITPLTADPHGPKNRVRDRMNERVSKLAAELGARVWEAGPAAYETIAETRRRDPAYREAPDFVHPGKLGHLAMAAAFCRAVGETAMAQWLDDEAERRYAALEATLGGAGGRLYAQDSAATLTWVLRLADGAEQRITVNKQQANAY
jgi:adenylylsulfate reductase subunit B